MWPKSQANATPIINFKRDFRLRMLLNTTRLSTAILPWSSVGRSFRISYCVFFVSSRWPWGLHSFLSSFCVLPSIVLPLIEHSRQQSRRRLNTLVFQRRCWNQEFEDRKMSQARGLQSFKSHFLMLLCSLVCEGWRTHAYTMTRLLQSTSVDTNLLPFQQPSEKTDKMSDLRATCICVCLCCDLVSVCMYAQIQYLFDHK